MKCGFFIIGDPIEFSADSWVSLATVFLNGRLDTVNHKHSCQVHLTYITLDKVKEYTPRNNFRRQLMAVV
jgi:hypothetical protein